MTSPITEKEQGIKIPRAPYFNYDIDDPSEAAWAYLADAVRLHDAAHQLHRDRYSSGFASLSPEQQVKRTALLDITFKVIMASAEQSLQEAFEFWLKSKE